MSAPGCTVYFRDPISDAQAQEWIPWLSKFGMVSPRWEKNCLDLTRRAATGEESPPEIMLLLGDPGMAYDPSLADPLRWALSWSPSQWVAISGYTKTPESHRFAGLIAGEVAERHRGMIHLSTICLSRRSR